MYRRPTPDGLISLSSDEGQERLQEALIDGNARAFTPLMSSLLTQDEIAYCGLATLATVLNTLKIDPQIQWKFPWRWFTEQAFQEDVPLDKVREVGTCMEELAYIGSAHKAKVKIVRQPTLAELESLLRTSIGVRPPHGEQYYIGVNYIRGGLGQTVSTGGHFSPIAAYHNGSKSCLVLDTSRFKYEPFWVELEVLRQATLAVDTDIGKPRGFVVISKATHDSQKSDCLPNISISQEPVSQRLPDVLAAKEPFNAYLDSIQLDVEQLIHALKEDAALEKMVATIWSQFGSEPAQQHVVLDNVSKHISKIEEIILNSHEKASQFEHFSAIKTMRSTMSSLTGQADVVINIFVGLLRSELFHQMGYSEGAEIVPEHCESTNKYLSTLKDALINVFASSHPQSPDRLTGLTPV